MLKWVRSAARALIIRDGQLLAVRMQRVPSQVFYILPGGGQRHGETLQDTLQRECLEEIGTKVIPGEIAYVREYIGRHHHLRKLHKDFHQLEVVFHCSLPEGVEPSPGTERDRLQIGVEWLPLSKLNDIEFYPEVLKKLIDDGQVNATRLYLGDIN
ncbi:NUDIX domain-containing protein [Ruficoccus sp. ZRK36]|uniref:NUDIX domain-containing protein n=1 Tax=Ruficoccus sp. ZRK36 TaxID=2866311 RepID=UPI001C72B606|nr:NUDIX domain-containing protein [Ruficoccus sp. ZRK36]QYY36438.1 NUDIX domain-containing protein [Ruficoccus sp. ZRK36]